MKLIMSSIILLLLSGCQMLSGVMGQTEYTVEPIVLADGTVVCCKVNVFNSKDYENFKFKLKKNVDGTIEVTLDEKGVNASDPATVNAQNQGKMLDTITGLLPLIQPKDGTDQ